MKNTISTATPVSLAKQELRQNMLQKRILQEKNLAAEQSEHIADIILAEKCWHNATRVAMYMPIRGEVNTQKLLHAAWKHKKTVLLPRCHAHKKGDMDFIPCKNITDLERGAYHILEPARHLKPYPKNKEHAPHIILVPGLAFDKKGARIGFGGGYYDQMLKQEWLNKSIFMALAFDWQIVPIIPAESFDIKMHALVTKDGILWI